MIQIITIKDVVKKEKEFPNGTIFAFMFLWTVLVAIILFIGFDFSSFVFSFDFSDISSDPAYYNVVKLGFINQLIGFLIGSVFLVGIAQLSYSIVRGKGKDLSIAFQVWTNKKIFKRMLAVILSYVIMWIGLILLIVPGIILYYAFISVRYILIDEDYQSLSVIETLKKSWELMKNNKMKLFLLQLKYFLPFIIFTFVASIIFTILLVILIIMEISISLIPLILLLLIPFIIGAYVYSFYIYSKYYIALAIFYKQIKEDNTIQPIEEV